jgi:hypothetical protein
MVTAKRLDRSNHVIDIFTMKHRTAVKIVKKRQGAWIGKNLIIIYWVDQDGRSHPPYFRRESKNMRYVIPGIVRQLHYCVVAQERQRMKSKKVTPIPGITIPRKIRNGIREQLDNNK